MIASTNEIVRSIQLCGDQLIKDAKLIAGDFYAHQCLDIRISIDLEHRAIPTICIDSEYIPESYLNAPDTGWLTESEASEQSEEPEAHDLHRKQAGERL